MRTDYLFTEQATIHDVVRHQELGTNRALDELVAEEILSQSLEDLSAKLTEEFSLEVPILDRAATVQLPNEEIEIDVSQDPMRVFFDRSEPHYVKGTAIQIAVPFTGDPQLFKYGASPFGSRIPGRVDDGNVVLTYRAENPEADKVRSEFENNAAQIETMLQMIRGPADEWNRRLPGIVRSRLEARRTKIERDQTLNLGYPLAPQKATQQVAKTVTKAQGAQQKGYDLFLSHASEDKNAIARPLYIALSEEGVSVWFDEAVLELGDSLRRKIDEGLAKCRFGVVILSPRFLSKQWPQRELDGLVARETASGEKAILPIWHELDRDTLMAYSPPLADRLAGRSEEGIGALVQQIMRVLGK